MNEQDRASQAALGRIYVLYAALFGLTLFLDRAFGFFHFGQSAGSSNFLGAFVWMELFWATSLGSGLFLFGRLARIWPSWRELETKMADLVPVNRFSDAFLLAGFSAMAEEALFRGILQEKIGWVWASLLFGAVHVGPSKAFLPWTGFAILAGFGFGYLYRWTGNLWMPIWAHFLANLLALAWMVKQSKLHPKH